MDVTATDMMSSQNGGSKLVFLNSSGRPLHVFVETAEFLYRPKLIRELRRGGAIIAHYPSEAQIILVDMETEAGKQFVTDWGSEKVILNWQWARKSIDIGRALLAEDDWGGYRIDDQNRILSNNFEHPLPTPLQTPPHANLSAPDFSDHSTLSSSTSKTLIPPVVPVPTMQISNGVGTAPPIPVPSPLAVTAEIAAAMALLSPQGIQQLLTQLRAGLMSSSQVIPPILAASQENQPSLPNLKELEVNGQYSPETSQRLSVMSEDSVLSAPAFTASPSLKRKELSPETLQQSNSLQYKDRKRRRSDYSRPVAGTSTVTINSLSAPSSSQARLSRTSRNDEEIFKTDAGDSMMFYVQIETRNRGEVVQSIRKHGGKIVPDIPQADVVILAQHTKPFSDWLRRAQQAKRPTAQASYVHDCITEGSILDIEPYSFGDFDFERKRGRPSKSPRKVSSPEAKVKKNKSMPKAKASRDKGAENGTSEGEHWEHSPSPPRHIVTKGGKNLFTSEEHEYFLRYIPVLMSRNPEMTLQAIADKLFEKMPHHPGSSWRSWLGKQTVEVDKWRKKAYIARRKADHDSIPTGSQLGQPEDSSSAQACASSPVSSSLIASPVENSYGEDFQTITNFLAGGGADDRTDEEVWEVLAQQAGLIYHAPSRSAREWQNFWNEHGSDINAVVQKLMKPSNAPCSSEEPYSEKEPE
ncbi:uncharacterized protein FIBRA_01025 [Fibroporia radiculosa]|uniref:BRCT domain-containing protein n=1 Tax=Fibroporia radiculosa TaxID=599839 RepID=J4I894_9APHY|nr:uncharacterized protein FIBRA_01025 [Fibroporia radiculosa]CCL99016.1 predicted protein [Fibroporia radiculosa]